jgi:predicted nucleic acid-binding protein
VASGIVVVDSTVVIDLLHDHPDALAFSEQHPVSRWALHPVVEAEVLTGAGNAAELRSLDRALHTLPRLRMTSEDADHALAFVRRYHLSTPSAGPTV